MKTWNSLALFAIAAVTAGGLIACSKTSNSGTASTPASTCYTNQYGQFVDQYGRNCSNYGYNQNSCVNTRYNYTTGQYLNTTTGQPVNCQSQGYFDNYNSIPYYGQYGNTQINGCAGWTQVTGAYYVPVDFGNGQLVCMNTAYLQQQNPTYNYNWNQMYYTQTPMYSCMSYDCNGGGGYYYGQQYSCQSSFNFGFVTSGFGMSLGSCY